MVWVGHDFPADADSGSGGLARVDRQSREIEVEEIG